MYHFYFFLIRIQFAIAASENLDISRDDINNTSSFQGKRLNGINRAEGRDDVSAYVICICKMHSIAPPGGHCCLIKMKLYTGWIEYAINQRTIIEPLLHL